MPYKESSTAQRDVYIQDQTTPPIEHWLTNQESVVTIQSNVDKFSNIIILDAFTVGSITGGSGYYIEISYVEGETIRFFQSEIITITDNSPSNVTIEVDTPLDFDLDTTYIEASCICDANAVRVSTGAGAGSSAIKMTTTPPDGLKWDLTRLMVVAITEGNPDDGKFLGDAALTWGLFGGATTNTNVDLHLVNIKTNGDFRATAYDVIYTTRTLPAGTYGVSVRKTFGGQDKYGVVIRLDGANNDKFFIALQDNFSDNASDCKFKIMGHVVED